MAIGLSNNLAQAALMGQKPEEEQNNLMQAGLGLGGAAFAAQVGRAPAPVPMGGQLSPLAQQVAQNDAARQAAVRQAAAAPRPIGSNLPTNPASPAVGSSGSTRLPSNPSLATARQAATTSAQRAVPGLASRVLPLLGQAGSAFAGGYTLGSVLDKAFDISGNIARGLSPNEPTLTREERAALGQPGVEAVSDMVARPGETEEFLLSANDPLNSVQLTGQQMLGQAGVPSMNELVSGMQEMGQPSATSEETAPQPPEISVMKTPEQVISGFGASAGVPNLENVSTAMQNPAVFTPASFPTPEVPTPLSPIDTTFESQGQTMAIPAGGSFEDRFVPTAQQLSQFEQQQPATGTAPMQEFAGGMVGERPAELTRTIDPMTGQVVFADPATALAMGQQELAQRQRDFAAQQRAIQELAGSDVGFDRMPADVMAEASRQRVARMEEGKRMRDAQLPGGAASGTFTKSELNRIAKGQARDATPREKAEAIEILQRSGQYDPITGKREPTEAEKTKEQLEIDYIQGRIDNLAPTATEKQKDQLEVDLLEAQIKKAKESLEPEDIEVVVKGGWSYITKNGQYQIGRFIDLEDKTPAGIREADEKVQRIKNARDLYQKGDKTGAQDILASLDIKDMAGLPAQADDYFGTVTDYGFGDKGNADIQKALGANPGVSVGDIIKEMISKGKL
jgi:hypothetical protein